MAAPRRFVVGLTGGIGCGKSAVARLLEELGAAVLDADAVVHDLYEPGGEGARALAALLGDGILDARGGVDRPRLGPLLFADGALRARVEARVHPLVVAAIDRWVATVPSGRLPVVEAALLVETGLHRRFSRLVVVTCPEETQVARLLARDAALPAEEARRRVAAQLPSAEKARHAHHLVDNAGTLEDLRAACGRLHGDLVREMAEAEA